MFSFRIIILGAVLIVATNIYAQKLIKPIELQPKDSVQIQTTNGLFNYGFLIKYTDSIISFSYREDLSDPISFKTNKVAQITLLHRKEIDKEITNDNPSRPRSERVDITTTQNEQTEVQAYQSEIKKYETTTQYSSSKKVAQIVLGSLAGYSGAALGAILGVSLGSSLDVGFSETYAIWGGILGAATGSIAATSYVVYKTGETDEYTSSYKETLKGTAIGFACGIIIYPFMPVIGATGGYMMYNKSRVRIDSIR